MNSYNVLRVVLKGNRQNVLRGTDVLELSVFSREVGLDSQGAELNSQEAGLSDRRGRSRLSLGQIFSGLRGPGGGLLGRRSWSLDRLSSQTPATPQGPLTPQVSPRPPRTCSLQNFSLVNKVYIMYNIVDITTVYKYCII